MSYSNSLSDYSDLESFQYGYHTQEHHYITEYLPIQTENSFINTPYVRVAKRRTTANKKERRRTQSINNAYADLRDCIPNVPSDTKLSKIKTLRLATSYILYLTRALETNDNGEGFKAELESISRKSNNNELHARINHMYTRSKKEKEFMEENESKKTGRTGWPQHVWALELKQEQSLQ